MINTITQYILPKHILSRLAGKIASCRFGPIKNFIIDLFCKHYQIDLSEAVESDPHKYVTFNDFFVRSLKSGARILDSDPQAIISPVDGKVMQFGKCEASRLITAKKSNFTVAQLIGDEQEAAAFKQGSFAVLYLAPHNYHRVHMPFSGKLRKVRHIPGNLFSVNPEIVENIPNVLARNERVVTIFDTDIGPMAVVMVGAMIVGSIETVTALDTTYNRGDEIGRFKLGSTVILLFPENAMEWDSKINTNYTIRMGSKIGYNSVHI